MNAKHLIIAEVVTYTPKQIDVIGFTAMPNHTFFEAAFANGADNILLTNTETGAWCTLHPSDWADNYCAEIDRVANGQRERWKCDKGDAGSRKPLRPAPHLVDPAIIAKYNLPTPPTPLYGLAAIHADKKAAAIPERSAKPDGYDAEGLPVFLPVEQTSIAYHA